MNGPERPHNWALRVIIILGIVFFLPATVNFGIATFIGRPEAPKMPAELYSGDTDKETREKARTEYEKARNIYEAASKRWARTAFWISLPIGFAALFAGFFPRLGDIGTGLMGAGLVIIGMSHLAYNRGIGDPERFLSLLLGFGVLVTIGYRRILRAQRHGS